LLSLILVLAHFTSTVLTTAAGVNESCVKACRAFLALIEVCELISSTARHAVQPARLLGRIHKFLALFVDSWGYDWMLHYADALAKNGRLFNCFCLERKHRTPKRYTEDFKKILRETSKSLLADVFCHQFQQLNSPAAFDFDVGLVGGRPCPRMARQGILRFLGNEFCNDPIEVANVARINAYETCAKGDAVLLRDDDGTLKVGRVAQHLSLDGHTLSIIHQWTLVLRVANTYLYIYNTSADGEIWRTSEILAAVVHTVFPDGTAGILMPMEWRR
jgi:hypothetical protein